MLAQVIALGLHVFERRADKDRSSFPDGYRLRRARFVRVDHSTSMFRCGGVNADTVVISHPAPKFALHKANDSHAMEISLRLLSQRESVLG
ncbi:MAG: hypothetical protein JNM18_26270 [Planctomycetaceae bacterium]|nr:hypothetical protein [Planctomycetaceae bacterium]